MFKDVQLDNFIQSKVQTFVKARGTFRECVHTSVQLWSFLLFGMRWKLSIQMRRLIPQQRTQRPVLLSHSISLSLHRAETEPIHKICLLYFWLKTLHDQYLRRVNLLRRTTEPEANGRLKRQARRESTGPHLHITEWHNGLDVMSLLSALLGKVL